VFLYQQITLTLLEAAGDEDAFEDDEPYIVMLSADRIATGSYSRSSRSSHSSLSSKHLEPLPPVAEDENNDAELKRRKQTSTGDLLAERD